MKRLLSSLCILLLGVALSAAILLISSPPRGTQVRLLPTYTPAPLVVDISGAVRSPGVYELPVNCRVKDAVDAAGGLLPGAARDTVNLAAHVRDGEKLVISLEGTRAAKPPTGESSGSVTVNDPAPKEPSEDLSGPVNINTATVDELDILPGIGPGIAGRIIEYRETHGPFTAIEQIQDVSGIGDSRFEQIKSLIVVE